MMLFLVMVIVVLLISNMPDDTVNALVLWFGFGVLLGLAHLVVPILGPIVLFASVIVVTMLVGSIRQAWKEHQEAAIRRVCEAREREEEARRCAEQRAVPRTAEDWQRFYEDYPDA